MMNEIDRLRIEAEREAKPLCDLIERVRQSDRLTDQEHELIRNGEAAIAYIHGSYASRILQAWRDQHP